MINGTEKTHFSVLFILDEDALIDLLAECKSSGNSAILGVIVESEDAKYKTETSTKVMIERLALCGDASDTFKK